MLVSTVAFCDCGSTTSSDGTSANPTEDDAALPHLADGGARPGNDNPGLSAGAANSSLDSGGAAQLGCTGAHLDDDNWDTCPEELGAGPNCDCNGYAPNGGMLASSDSGSTLDVTSFLLPIPMTPGASYAFSFALADNGFYGDIELWGTTHTCGPGLERLYVAPIASRTYCVNVVASQAYTYVLLAQRLSVDGGALASFSASQFMACPTDHCP